MSDLTKSVYLGCTSAWKDPDRYNAAILSLFKYFCDSKKNDGIPLVVNTAGWVKGMGYDILQNLISELKPTQVVCLQQEPSGMAGTLSAALSTILAEDPKSLYTIESVSEGYVTFELFALPHSSRPNRVNAADQRTLSTISYFHQLRKQVPSRYIYEFESPDTKPWWDFETHVSHRVPYCVPLDSFRIEFPFDEVCL